MKISEYLGKGIGKEKTTNELKAQTGLNSREIRNAVHAERLRGVAILSNHRGYFLADNYAEKVYFAASMHRRAREINKAANAVLYGNEPIN